MESLVSAFDGASLEELMGHGPKLSDFVSSSPSDLPTFSPTSSHSRESAENRLEFQIFVDGVDCKGAAGDKRSCVEVLKQLNQVRGSILDLVPSNHIWHLAPMTIDSPQAAPAKGWSPSTPHPPHLTGSLSFGEALDDEWLAVSILTEASKRDVRLAITARDDDGEFLLIETSSSWPRALEAWLEPEVAVNRVWIRGGDLHIITAATAADSQNDDDDDGDDGDRGEGVKRASSSPSSFGEHYANTTTTTAGTGTSGGGSKKGGAKVERRRGPLGVAQALGFLRHRTQQHSGHDPQATAAAAAAQVGYGDRVELRGLVSNPLLNGRRGVCVGQSSARENRLVVLIAEEEEEGGAPPAGRAGAGGSGGGQTGARVRVRRENVTGPLTEAPPRVLAHFHTRAHSARHTSAVANVHRVKCVLPLQVAWLLRRCPQLVSLAVHALYLRTPADTLASSKSKRFGPPPSQHTRTPAAAAASSSSPSTPPSTSSPYPPPPNPSDGAPSPQSPQSPLPRPSNGQERSWSLAPVQVVVRLTKCLFAQLEQQQHLLHPPPHLVAAWTAHRLLVASSPSPALNRNNRASSSLLEWDEKSLARGLCLTAAFEMLYSSSSSLASSSSSSSSSSPSPSPSRALETALQKLAATTTTNTTTSTSLRDGQRLGSEVLLLRQGEVHALIDAIIVTAQEETAAAAAAAAAAAGAGQGVDDGQRMVGTQRAGGGGGECVNARQGQGEEEEEEEEEEVEDDDSWLNVTPEELEALLREGSAPPLVPNHGAGGAAAPAAATTAAAAARDTKGEGQRRGVQFRSSPGHPPTTVGRAGNGDGDGEDGEAEAGDGLETAAAAAAAAAARAAAVEEAEGVASGGVASLDAIVDGVHRFLDASGGAHTGAEVPKLMQPRKGDRGASSSSRVGSDGRGLLEPVSFDAEKVLDVLRGGASSSSSTAGAASPSHPSDGGGGGGGGGDDDDDDNLWGDDGEDGSEGGSESANDDEDGDDESDGEDENDQDGEKDGEALQSKRGEHHDNGPDDDDEGEEEKEEAFSGVYSEVLSDEIGASDILGKSFERYSAESSTGGDQGGGGDDHQTRQPHTEDARPNKSGKDEDDGEDDGEGGGEDEEEGGVAPVDLDANLVKHLLESFASQEGLAGPASNLLREMGVFFPTVKKEEEAGKKEKRKIKKKPSDGGRHHLDHHGHGGGAERARGRVNAQKGAEEGRKDAKEEARVPPSSFPSPKQGLPPTQREQGGAYKPANRAKRRAKKPLSAGEEASPIGSGNRGCLAPFFRDDSLFELD